MFEVEVRHNTTMWNEGFENAREPLVTVVVSSEADADRLADWVTKESAKHDAAREWDKLFNVKVSPARNGSHVLPVAEAELAVYTAVYEWEGV